MSETMWTCEVSGLPTDGLTVGAIFDLKCEGAEVSGFSPQTLTLELPKADKYRLRILENRKSSSTSIELGVTSYVAGESKLQDVVLNDGVNRVSLSGISFSVNSVLKEAEEPKPFPPEAPVSLSWPLSVLLAIGAVALGIIGLVAFLLQRQNRRRKFTTWLAANRTPLSPFDQLNKDLRRAMKERDPILQIKELENITRLFLTRSFEVPLMSGGTQLILKTISGGDRKKRHRLTPLTIRLFGEFDRVSQSLVKSQLTVLEALNVTLPQIHDLVREFGESVKVDNRKTGRGT